MFQVEPILWLQASASTGLTWTMRTITLLGYTPVYVTLVLVLAFAFRLRATLGVLLALLLAGIVTDGVKMGIGFPRPSDVDTRVVEPGDTAPVAVVARGGAPGFWSLPPREAVAAVRGRSAGSYGFPSGHVASAATFFLAAVLFYRSRRAWLLASVWPLLMGLSRMYLGRHFLADVLGGLVIGYGAAVAARALIGDADEPAAAGTWLRQHAPLVTIAGLLVVLAPFVPLLPAENVGRLAAFVVIYAPLARRGFPSDAGTIAQRCGRVVVAALVFVVLSRAADMAFEAAGWEDLPLATVIGAIVVTAATFGGGVAIPRRLGWYRDGEARTRPPALASV